MEQGTNLDEVFSEKFSAGLNNIKFFIDPNQKASADEIRADVVAFQAAIDSGRVEKIESVD